MRNQMKSHELTRQSEENVKKSQKHDVNLQKNSTLYFQVGLIVCLLFTYGLLEMEFASKKFVPDIVYNDSDPLDYVQEKFEIYKEPVKEIKEAPKAKAKLIDKVEIVKNDAKEAKEALEVITAEQITTDKPVKIEDVIKVVAPPEPVDVPYAFVEKVPVYPGCENASTNEERRVCMSKKIAKHIQRKFDAGIASELGLSGKQKIHVGFKINKYGEVTEVRAITKYKALKLEAEDVIGKLPKMTPGKQHNKNVSVVYSQPIVFNVPD